VAEFSGEGQQEFAGDYVFNWLPE